MDSLNTDLWVKEIIQKVAEECNVLITEDDPVLLTAILNKKLIEYFFEQQKVVLVGENTKLFDQFDIQHQNNQKVFISVAEKLVKNFNPRIITKEYSTKKTKSDMFIIALVFILGLALGYIFSMIN